MTRAEWRRLRAGANSPVCPEGAVFLRRHATLGSAWRSCKVGSWMAYWLLHMRAPRHRVRLQRSELYICVPSSSLSLRAYMLTGYSATAAGQLQFAKNIRAMFNSDGSRRKRAAR